MFNGQLAESAGARTRWTRCAADALQGGVELYYREIGAIK